MIGNFIFVLGSGESFCMVIFVNVFVSLGI